MRKNFTGEDVRREVEEKDVEFIRLQFTDLFGNLKNVAITSSQLERALDNKIMFDCASVDGFGESGETEMYLYPDPETLEIFPWRPQHGKVARMICDVYKADGTPFEGDPRYILKQAIREAKEMGYTMQAGPECEFFLFHTDENGIPTTLTHEKAGYFDLGPIDLGENARRDIVLTLEEMGFEIESSHHEVAPAQHEIDFKYQEGIYAADDIMTFKLAVKTIAKRHGLHATFMPKPKSDVEGSGMHLNITLYKDGKNIFADQTDEKLLSDEAYYFIGGLMKHAKGMCALTNPLVNSYKRLVPGYEAPIYMTWSTKSRNPLIRIPVLRGEETRVELRYPDSSANPYLALAVALRAGLQGIREKIRPGDSIDENVKQYSDGQLKEKDIETLPHSLSEALQYMQQDDFVKEVLGKETAQVYLEAKKREWEEYRAKVSDWELERYLYKY